MLARRDGYIVALVALVSWACGACVIPINKKWVHEPPVGKHVTRIVEGVTTRTEAMQWFGAPDIETRGGESRASGTHPFIRMWGGAGLEEHLQTELEALFPYSGIDDRHEALVYVELKNTGFVVIPGGGVGWYYMNKLLLLVDKETNVVDEFAYREEFRAY